jgi:hypothetical protein
MSTRPSIRGNRKGRAPRNPGSLAEIAELARLVEIGRLAESELRRLAEQAPQAAARLAEIGQPSPAAVRRADMLALMPAEWTLIRDARKLIEHMLSGSPNAREKQWQRIRDAWEAAGLIVQDHRRRTIRRLTAIDPSERERRFLDQEAARLGQKGAA